MKEKKMLPVMGQDVPTQPAEAASRENGEAHLDEMDLDGAQRTVVRVEGMDCASCAATVEKSVGKIPGVHRATVNFAAGRLDAQHVPAVTVEQLEQAVRDAG